MVDSGTFACNPSRNSIKSILRGDNLFNSVIKKHQQEFWKMGSRWRRLGRTPDPAELWLQKAEAPRNEPRTPQDLETEGGGKGWDQEEANQEAWPHCGEGPHSSQARRASFITEFRYHPIEQTPLFTLQTILNLIIRSHARCRL